MATTSTVQAATASGRQGLHSNSINLSRLLARLESILLDPTPSNTQLRLLRQSQYERNRVGANVEHARTLLFRLEHDAPAGNSAGLATLHPSKSQAKSVTENKADVQRKRALLRRLQAALDELNHLPEDEHNVDAVAPRFEGAADEDLVARYANGPVKKDTPVAKTPAARTSEPASTATLRSRKGAVDASGTTTATTTTTTTGSSYSGAASTPKAAATTSPFAPAQPAPRDKGRDAQDAKTTANLLEAHDTEQTGLTDSLVQLATALRESTQAFSASLEGSNPLVDAAAAALDRNVSGLDKAGRRMGSLRRMTEGKGWLARLGLYGWIAVLWVALVLLVFLLPKLRFR